MPDVLSRMNIPIMPESDNEAARLVDTRQQGVTGTYTQVSGTPANEFEFNDLQTFLDEKVNHKQFDWVTINTIDTSPIDVMFTNITCKGSFSLNSTVKLAPKVELRDVRAVTVITAELSGGIFCDEFEARSNSGQIAFIGDTEIPRFISVGNVAVAFTGIQSIPTELWIANGTSVVNGTLTCGTLTNHSTLIVSDGAKLSWTTYNPVSRGFIVDNNPGSPLETYLRQDDERVSRVYLEGSPGERKSVNEVVPGDIVARIEFNPDGLGYDLTGADGEIIFTNGDRIWFDGSGINGEILAIDPSPIWIGDAIGNIHIPIVEINSAVSSISGSSWFAYADLFGTVKRWDNKELLDEIRSISDITEKLIKPSELQQGDFVLRLEVLRDDRGALIGGDEIRFDTAFTDFTSYQSVVTFTDKYGTNVNVASGASVYESVLEVNDSFDSIVGNWDEFFGAVVRYERNTQQGIPGTYTQVSGTPASEFEFNDLQAFLDAKINGRDFDGYLEINISGADDTTSDILLYNVHFVKRDTFRINATRQIGAGFTIANIKGPHEFAFDSSAVKTCNDLLIHTVPVLRFEGNSNFGHANIVASPRTFLGYASPSASINFDSLNVNLGSTVVTHHLDTIVNIPTMYVIGVFIIQSNTTNLTVGSIDIASPGMIIDNRPGRPLETYQRKDENTFTTVPDRTTTTVVKQSSSTSDTIIEWVASENGFVRFITAAPPNNILSMSALINGESDNRFLWNTGANASAVSTGWIPVEEGDICTLLVDIGALYQANSSSIYFCKPKLVWASTPATKFNVNLIGPPDATKTQLVEETATYHAGWVADRDGYVINSLYVPVSSSESVISLFVDGQIRFSSVETVPVAYSSFTTEVRTGQTVVSMITTVGGIPISDPVEYNRISYVPPDSVAPMFVTQADLQTGAQPGEMEIDPVTKIPSVTGWDNVVRRHPAAGIETFPTFADWVLSVTFGWFSIGTGVVLAHPDLPATMADLHQNGSRMWTVAIYWGGGGQKIVQVYSAAGNFQRSIHTSGVWYGEWEQIDRRTRFVPQGTYPSLAELIAAEGAGIYSIWGDDPAPDLPIGGVVSQGFVLEVKKFTNATDPMSYHVTATQNHSNSVWVGYVELGYSPPTLEWKMISKDLFTYDPVPIGKYYDGRTIYRRMYEGNLPVLIGLDNSLDLGPIGDLISIQGFARSLSFPSHNQPVNASISGGLWTAYRNGGNYLIVVWESGADFEGAAFWLIVEYLDN